jgi:hypothetical protein
MYCNNVYSASRKRHTNMEDFVMNQIEFAQNILNRIGGE